MSSCEQFLQEGNRLFEVISIGVGALSLREGQPQFQNQIKYEIEKLLSISSKNIWFFVFDSRKLFFLGKLLFFRLIIDGNVHMFGGYNRDIIHQLCEMVC